VIEITQAAEQVRLDIASRPIDEAGLAMLAKDGAILLNELQWERPSRRTRSTEDMMGYRLDAQDEYPHTPSAEPHFNESVYCNGFDRRTGATGAGGWMRLGKPGERGLRRALGLSLSAGRAHRLPVSTA
jgi:hypothetical protein